MLSKNFKLNNGVEIPAIALGTWQMDNDQSEKAVIDAVYVGYRHIDTAVQYENEEGVGLCRRKADD